MNSNKTQKGQAIIEGLVAFSTVLVAIIILLPILSKFIESSQRVDSAARYVAWERTVWQETGSLARKSDKELEREIHWRFFSKADRLLSSDDDADSKKWQAKDLSPMMSVSRSDSPINVSKMPLYQYQSEQSQTSNKKDDSKYVVKLEISDQDTPGRISGFLNGMLSLIDFGGFKVNRRGLVAGKITYQMNKLTGVEPFENIETEPVSGELYLLSDGWNSHSNSHNKKMVEGLTPSSILNTGFIRTVQNALGWLPVAKEIRTSSLKLGHVDVNQVPEQRLCTIRGLRCQGGRRRW